MQGQRSSVSTLPDLSFDHGSTSSDVGIDSQVPWNSMQTSAEARLPEYRIPSNETNTQYSHAIVHSQWSLGESSSGAARSQSDHSEKKREHRWSVHPRAVIDLEECQLESSNILSLDNVDVNGQGNQTSNGSSFLQISGPDSVHHDLSTCSELVDEKDDDCQVIEPPNRHISLGSSNEKLPSIGSGSSSNALGISSGCGGGGYVMEDSNYRPGCSLEGRRLSCKRKALEAQVGQSSGAGSSNCFEHVERSQWHAVTSAAALAPAHAQISGSNVSMSAPVANNLVLNNGSEQPNSRIRLGVGEAVSSNPLSSNARRNAESSRRNLRLRLSGSHQQDQIPSIPLSREANVGISDVSSSRHASRLVLRNRLFDSNPTPPVENASHPGQSVLQHIPSVRRNPHSRWSGASSSRTSNLSSPAFSLERDRDPMLYEESTSGNIPRSISEHPMFISASEMGGSSQQPPNWNLSGWSNSSSENAVSAPRAGSTAAGVNSSSPSPSWSHRNYPQHPRRISEFVRRSLLSAAGTEPGGQSSSTAMRSSLPGTSQETALPSGSRNARSALLERHLDSAFGIPYSHRSLGAASEGRSSVMSEQIRHVLDLMRRGEGLRMEDMMMLDHSVFFGMADIHDRHREMRLDVDNMSYEELLALEERIGDVCTGLNEEKIMTHLKQHIYSKRRADEAETEPCSICREEYNDGENLGTLECGHAFHRDCIKQWLMQKNLCPICKTAGLST